MELSGKKINFLGDSITMGYGASNSEHGFVAIIGRENDLAAARNYGIGGTRFAKQHTPSKDFSYDWDFCSRYTDMNPDADVVFVMGGTNDYGHGDAPLGTMDDRTPDTFYGALHTLFAGLTERYPNADIVVATPTHRLNEDKIGRDAGHLCHATVPLCEYVRIIRQVAEYYALPVLDLWSVSGIQPNDPWNYTRYTTDGLHPNDEGYKLLAKRISSFLKTL